MAVTQEFVAETDSQIFNHTNQSMVPGRDVTAEAPGVLGTVDRWKGDGALFDRVVGDDVM